MEKTSFFHEQGKNKLKSTLLAFSVFFFILALGYLMGAAFAPGIAIPITLFSLIFSLGYTWYTYSHSAEIVLKSVNARPANRAEFLHLNNVVEGLALAAGIPTPKIYVMESNELNAFATGKDPQHAVICVTTGLLKTLNKEELEGVIAHEMSHIGNYDVRFMTLIAAMVGVVAIMSEIFIRGLFHGGGDRGKGHVVLIVVGLLLAIIAPFVTRMIQLSVSRKREFLADATGAQLTRYPEGLASALEKIGKTNKGNMQVSEAVSHFFIADPVKSHLDSFFATHPPIQERIKILRSM